MQAVEAPAQAIRRRLRGKQPPPPDEKDDLVAPSTVRRRIRGKQPPPPNEKDDLMEQVCWITDRLRPDVGAESTHPHRALEDDVTNLAKELRPMPTIPLGKSVAELERGEAWP
eukprot:4728933-Amphidinium_carterae.1